MLTKLMNYYKHTNSIQLNSRYFYSSKLELEKNDIKTNVELLIAADKLCIDDLCNFIEDYLLNDEKLLVSNFALILNLKNKYQHFKKLSHFYEHASQKDPSLIFKANDFTTIKRDLLLDILIKNNHSLKPIELWDKLVEWAISQSNNELPSDITKWTANNVSMFGDLIQQFIPHINFKEIDQNDFTLKIKPFKSIFDDKFYI